MTPERAKHILKLDELLGRYDSPGCSSAPVPVELLRSMRAELAGEDEAAFDLCGHLTAPSRLQPFTSAAAVNLSRGRSIL